MLTESEHNRYRSRTSAPISGADWDVFAKIFADTEVGDFFYVYDKGASDIVRISQVHREKLRYEYVDSDGNLSGVQYIWTLIRKATKSEVEEAVEKLKKKIAFYEKPSKK